MPTHDVEMSIPTTKVVELRVSKGTLDWAPMSAKIPVRMTWEQFDRFMRER